MKNLIYLLILSFVLISATCHDNAITEDPCGLGPMEECCSPDYPYSLSPQLEEECKRLGYRSASSLNTIQKAEFDNKFANFIKIFRN